MSESFGLPLHLRPDDFSPEACKARLLLHVHMSQINPNGWRKRRSHVRLRSRAAVGAREKRSVELKYRLDSLAVLAALSGKAAILGAVPP